MSQVTPRALAVDADGSISAALTDHGMFLRSADDASGWSWACSGAVGMDDAAGVLAVGAERILAWGPSGVSVSQSSDGCTWREMAGQAGLKPIAAVYQPELGGLRVVFAIGDESVRKVAVTVDGGATSTTLDGLSVGNYRVLSMAGRGDRLVLAAAPPDGTGVVMWTSEDLGTTWSSPEDLSSLGAFVPIVAGTADTGVVIGLLDGEVGTWGPAMGWIAEETVGQDLRVISGNGRALLLSDTGSVWAVHLSDVEGPLGDLSWTAASFGKDDDILLGTPALAGAGWQMRLRNGAVTQVGTFPEEVTYPAACRSRFTSECAVERGALDDALGLTSEPEVAEPPPPTPEQGCRGGTEDPAGGKQGWLLVLAGLAVAVLRRGKQAS